MSAISFAKQAYSAFNREKPHSSITEWVEILTSPTYDDEAYDGIPELVDSISIQATGPAEASRAIRKKLKHGDSHQQYRALVILRALVENGGHKFQTSFADAQLTDAIKTMVSDPTTDPKVKKKLVAVLAGWHSQFKDDPSMAYVAGLYKQCRLDTHRHSTQLSTQGLVMDAENERKAREEKERKREEEKRKAKEEERQRKEEEERRKREEKEKKKKAIQSQTQPKTKRKPFNFEEEKPQILTAIANASQATNNLVNAMTLVNPEQDSVATNARVQECLTHAKVSRKQIVRYIQLVENEDMIGTLIDTNERIISALQTYDRLSNPDISEQDVKDVQEGLAATKISDSELGKLQQKQRAAVQRSISRSTLNNSWTQDPAQESGHTGPYVHPDLQDLSFGSLGADQRNLPPPIRPSVPPEEDFYRGNLSDYSDYESSDEEEHNRAATSSSSAAYTGKHYVNVSDDNVGSNAAGGKALLHDEEDPFADPFADQ